MRLVGIGLLGVGRCLEDAAGRIVAEGAVGPLPYRLVAVVSDQPVTCPLPAVPT